MTHRTESEDAGLEELSEDIGTGTTSFEYESLPRRLSAEEVAELKHSVQLSSMSIRLAAERWAASPPPTANPRLPVYRDTLRVTSDLLLRTDWRKLKTSPYILESAIKAIRDAIRYLEQIREKQPEGSKQLEQVLEPSYAALTTLYKALDLGSVEGQAGPFFDQIAQGRTYLQKAIYAFPLEQQETPTS